MLGPNDVTKRVLGEMLLTRQYNHQNICILGRAEEINTNSRQFVLKTTDQKKIPVASDEIFEELLDGMVQVRGKYDGQRIHLTSYSRIPSKECDDFDESTYNSAVEVLKNATC